MKVAFVFHSIPFLLLLLLVQRSHGSLIQQPQQRSLRTTTTTTRTAEEDERFLAQIVISQEEAQDGGVDTSEMDQNILGGSATSQALSWHVYLEGAGCGGTLIRSNIVMTAAHCVDPVLDGRVCPSKVRIGSLARTSGGTVIDVIEDSCVVHPNYTKSPNRYDIAIMRLSQAADEKPILVNSLDSVPPLPPDDNTTIATAYGFGRVSNVQNAGSPTLQQVDLIPNENCSTVIGDGYFPEHHLCFNSDEDLNPGAGVCSGDSGGPLIILQTVIGETTPIQIGIASFINVANNCGGGGVDDVDGVDVFAKVSTYIEWLDDAVKELQARDFPDCACFSETATVHVRGKLGQVAMNDLQVGDAVLTGNGDYQPVYAFGHQQKDAHVSYLQITTTATGNHTAAAPLEITGRHMIYLHGKRNPVRADSVQVGDVLQGHDSDNMGLTITKINILPARRGMYAPLTHDGSLIVDGIKASSYVSLQQEAVEYIEFQGRISSGISQHDMIHMVLSPYRLLCEKSWWFPESPKFCQAHTKEGVLLFASYGFAFAEWVDQLHILAQCLIFFLVVPLLASFWILESWLSVSSLTTSLIVVIIMGMVVTRRDSPSYTGPTISNSSIESLRVKTMKTA